MTPQPGRHATSATVLPFRLRAGYAVVAILLLAVEILIALFVSDRFVRPYLGDALAVALVYCALRATLDLGPISAAAIAFGVAVAIEFGQYLQILRVVGLDQSTLARTVLGSGYDPRDFLAYAAGAIVMLAIEGLRPRSAN